MERNLFHAFFFKITMVDDGGGSTFRDENLHSLPGFTAAGVSTVPPFLTLTQLQISEAALVALFMLFLLIEVITVKQVWKFFRPPTPSQYSASFTGEKTRAFFIIFLSVANLVRTISLLLIFLDPTSYSQPLIVSTPTTGGDPSVWMHSLLLGLPSILYLSAYSIIILFWAQVYITARYVNASGLKPCFGFLNAAIYLVLIVVAVLTKLLAAYLEFRLYMALLVGLLYTVSAIAFCFFGFRVAFQFSGDSIDRDQDTRKAAVVRRLLGLSVFCPLLFQLRGLFDLAVGFQLIPYQGHWGGQLPLTWETLIIFLSEWIPATLILFSFFPPNNQAVKRYRQQLNTASQGLTSPLLGSASQTRFVNSGIVVNSGRNNGVMMNFAPDNVYPLEGNYRQWK
eukprot:Protomagalhaensia_wolfi_Nauph_80__845@NODE_148_length_3420_cov_16_707187_g110_i0_p1_GENE_NODE_148_length_3420_cov_16_707187_g110_i0NODE_148_length_3420_cov_16_707187_g110_i0_p1_ORF_typecomplete_len396_score42_35DUF1084/PF06454_11/2e27Mpv17_PMP22/PF04117_12/7_5e03Mpv17_PMP22/PF04117_12/0_28_NODE_148_length_3420_cov_16_707187_g110_i013472534